MPCTYRVQVWRGDHWMTIWRGFSYENAKVRLINWERFEADLHDRGRIAIP